MSAADLPVRRALPTVALVGRPNVGKSTLFNRLTKSRDALVADFPGLTRDRHYGEGRLGDRPYLVVDTGGLEPVAREGLLAEMARQTQLAVSEADAVVFIVDGRDGLTPQDKRIAEALRRLERPVRVAVNKTEGMNRDIVTAEFHELGLGDPVAISAAHGEGVRALVEDLLEGFPVVADEPADDDIPRIAIVGRPNVGKSTLVNSLIGEERMIAYDEPGTTRDAIDVPFVRAGRRYLLIDTAGVRRKGRVFESIEKFSVVKTLQAIAEAHVVVLLIDATQGVSEQDAHIAGYILESGRSVVVAVNKWDATDDYQRQMLERSIASRLAFLKFAPVLHISALKRTGLAALWKSLQQAHASATVKMPTPVLTRLLQEAVAHQQPRREGRFRPKMRYAHQGGMNPPIVVIHGNSLEHVPDSYKRYLEGRFREHFKLVGTPMRIELRSGRNPFDGRGS